MIKIDDIRYSANEGCFIIRTADNYVMGEEICIGSNDSIDNYHDEEYTENGRKLFYENCEKGIFAMTMDDLANAEVPTDNENNNESETDTE